MAFSLFIADMTIAKFKTFGNSWYRCFVYSLWLRWIFNLADTEVQSTIYYISDFVCALHEFSGGVCPLCSPCIQVNQAAFKKWLI